MDELELSVENQEFADLENQGIAEVETSEEEIEVAEQSKTERNFEKDSAFAKLRREAEQAKKEKEMLARTLQQFGFQGTFEEIIDQANAHYLQKPIDEVRKERLQQELMQTEEAKINAELDYYRNKEIERIMQDDLKRIQNIDATVKSLDDLGNDFFMLIESGLDAEIAFNAVQAKRLKETKIAPNEIGKINSISKSEKTYYTPSEVDKLTSKDLDNPKIMKRVMESMTKWKQKN